MHQFQASLSSRVLSASCRLCEVNRNCVAPRGAGDWLIQYSAPRCVQTHVQIRSWEKLPSAHCTYSPAIALRERLYAADSEATRLVDPGEQVLE